MAAAAGEKTWRGAARRVSNGGNGGGSLENSRLKRLSDGPWRGPNNIGWQHGGNKQLWRHQSIFKRLVYVLCISRV